MKKTQQRKRSFNKLSVISSVRLSSLLRCVALLLQQGRSGRTQWCWAAGPARRAQSSSNQGACASAKVSPSMVGPGRASDLDLGLLGYCSCLFMQRIREPGNSSSVWKPGASLTDSDVADPLLPQSGVEGSSRERSRSSQSQKRGSNDSELAGVFQGTRKSWSSECCWAQSGTCLWFDQRRKNRGKLSP